MKRYILLFAMLIFFGTNSFSQKIGGLGAEISVLSLKPNYRMWISKTTGFEVFGGIASELEDFMPNDLEAGFKYLHAIMYKRTERTYIGVVGKWKWAKVSDPSYTINLPIGGVLIGKEWYSKQRHLKGLAIELGYQMGTKEYELFSPIGHIPLDRTEHFDEFPLILNLRYSFFSKR